MSELVLETTYKFIFYGIDKRFFLYHKDIYKSVQSVICYTHSLIYDHTKYASLSFISIN